METALKILGWLVFWPVILVYYALSDPSIRGILWGLIRFTLKWTVFFCVVLPFYILMFMFAAGVRATTGA